jgi:cell wall-associated NlpC family hydrolase
MQPRALLVVLGLAATTAACASSGATPRPLPSPSSPPETTAARPRGEALGHRLAATALEFRGVPYRNGGTSPAGFDCSGLVRYVLARHGVDVPRQTRQQYGAGRRIGRGDLQAGDLVFFSTVAPGASHVGIALDDDEFVHAPSSRGVVRVERLTTDYWRTRFIGARRVR